jgi:nucleoside phosphorylase
LNDSIDHASAAGQQEPLSPSVFRPAALLREARRQKGLPNIDVPPICILDPDGDIVRRLRKEGRSKPFEGWPCYHTQLDAFELGGQTVGIVGCAVGAPFAVLIAEELFESGCRLLLSVTSAGQIASARPTPYFVIIDRALRDEGTSNHYAAPSEYGEANAELVAMADDAIKVAGLRVIVGSTWTTDAPFRETAEGIEAAKRRGILAVEMEAAALYTFAKARPTLWGKPPKILRKVRLTERLMRCKFWKPSCKRESRSCDRTIHHHLSQMRP